MAKGPNQAVAAVGDGGSKINSQVRKFASHSSASAVVGVASCWLMTGQTERAAVPNSKNFACNLLMTKLTTQLTEVKA